MGDMVAFYDNTDIREGSFVCSGKGANMTAKDILGKLLNSEHELRLFCQSNNIIQNDEEHIFR